MNNTIILESLIAEFKSSNELEAISDSDVFELFALSQIVKDFDLENDELDDCIVDGGSDGGIDAFCVLIDDTHCSNIEQLSDLKINSNTIISVFISQSKYESSFKETALDKLIASLPFIFNLSNTDKDLLNRFNESLVEKIILFTKVWFEAAKKAAKININFSYNTRANEANVNLAFDSKVKQIIELTKSNVSSADVKFDINSSKELFDLFQKTKSNILTLKFKDNPTPISYSESEYGYIGVVLLRDYFDFIVSPDGKIREYIFESNVRHYQGETDFNEKIKKTLQEDKLRDFWWLNNGVTIVANKCSPFPNILNLEGVQIVNGLQTSFTIGNYYDKDLADFRSILVKVIVSEDKETIDKIISATNSQNPISPTLLRATDELQRKIEIYFIGKGYYYDRRKNYYKNLGKPASKIFSIQFTGQVVQAIVNYDPSSARSKPTSLIKEDKSYASIFNSNYDFQIYLNCCLLNQKMVNHFKITKTEFRAQVRNFSFHISRVLASIITQKAFYEKEDIKNLDLNSTSDEDIWSAYLYLEKIIKLYQEENPDENIINIAKSKKFTDYLNSKIESHDWIDLGFFKKS